MVVVFRIGREGGAEREAEQGVPVMLDFRLTFWRELGEEKSRLVGLQGLLIQRLSKLS